MDVLERLQKLMDARGWSMYRLAKESGLTESTISNIYRRNAIPSIVTLESICKGFGITLSQFFAAGELVDVYKRQPLCHLKKPSSYFVYPTH